MVFVPPRQFLSAEDEKKRYDLHQNSPQDLNYRRFLSRLFIPLQKYLTPGSHGLDFGSGPEPTLSRMLEEAGHRMTLFDHFYEPAPAALEQQYDFITATEVVEHLRDPQKELERLWTCLKQGGWLGIITHTAVGQDAFPQWYYKNDLTHICFFSGKTFAWLALRWNAEVVFADSDVVLFRKIPVSSQRRMKIDAYSLA
jgi:SAM-dependent methyltransferase